MKAHARLAIVLLALIIIQGCRLMTAQPDTLRFATFNVSLYFDAHGEITEALAGGQFEHARKVAAIIQQVRPDVLLLNEFDFPGSAVALEIFLREYLGVGQFGQEPIDYPHRFVAAVNTGVSTGVDLDGDGRIGVPGDAHGFGRFEGQYGMAVISRLPLDQGAIRTFRNFRWRDLPDAWWPRDPGTGAHYYSAAARAVLRLSSKSHWDVPVLLPNGRRVRLLAAHPTPPVFDGPEDRNGRRNHDEIRFWAEYLDGADFIYDDAGRFGGLPPDASFVIVGDLNADPEDGDSSGDPIGRLLQHPRVNGSAVPTSAGAVIAGRSEGTLDLHAGDAAADTADYRDPPDGIGNLRVDYVLPSVDLEIRGASVFWPRPGAPGADWLDATDHRLVWIDVEL